MSLNFLIHHGKPGNIREFLKLATNDFYSQYPLNSNDLKMTYIADVLMGSRILASVVFFFFFYYCKLDTCASL